METQKDAVKQFVGAWNGRGSEKSDAQSFWLGLLRALGIDEPTQFIQFELPIDVDDHKCFIDAWIPSTKVLIEQKSRGIDLEKPARQSDGKFLTPFRQALRYADALPYSRRPRWIVVCNFVELHVYDMDQFHRQREDYSPISIRIERLPHEFSRLNFLIDPNDENVDPSIKISKQAGVIVGDLYKAFERNFNSPGNHFAALNKLCVRLVFCLYAEDAFIFERNQFTDYMRAASDRQAALQELFHVLDTPEPRPKTLRAELDAFPYVNGDLFREESEIPNISREAAHYLLFDAGDDNQFNWLGISPTIFGALFESTLNPITRRAGGMHYTSVENIHKLIDPLFLDELHEEFQSIKRRRKNKLHELERFQFKLASLKFLDPACGSGNFLTETFLSLRKLENEVIRELYGMGAHCEIEVSIENFFGIEINDFAVAVARTALWIAENQMLQETEMIIHEEIKFLPLKSAAHIICGNALRLDWKEIVPDGVDFVISNPPFVGYTYQTPEQKIDLQSIFPHNKKLDYVSCWFQKAAEFMIGTETRAAFVSTNSIVQGEQIAVVWKKLFETIHIDFAHRSFKWMSESDDMAAVHCVIVGFSHSPNDREKIIFDGDQKIIAKNINAYLLDAPNVLIGNRTKPLCKVPSMRNGSMPIDGGNLIIKAEELDEFIQQEPAAQKFIRQLIGADEFIKGKLRYCLWLVDATEVDLKLPAVAERIEACRQSRLNSPDPGARKLAATPHLFREQINPSQFIIVPKISSERRKYIPIGFLTGEVIPSNTVQIIPNATTFHFGVLTSSLHMVWTKAICGRFEMRYIYSAHIVYNNFPWCERTSAIETTAARILEVRKQFPNRSLASLYDEETMPSDLRAAHIDNDLAVLDAYGFARDIPETEIVARLMEMYRQMTA